MDAFLAFLQVAGVIGLAILVLVLLNLRYRKPWR
jgi:hypothetical protein